MFGFSVKKVGKCFQNASPCLHHAARYLANTGSSPIKQYASMLEKGILKPDKHQFFAMLKLQEVFNNVKYYNNTKIEDPVDDGKCPKGLYLYGGVGTGKTLLLDLFYDSMPTKYKKRVHFNSFMLCLYSEINRWNLCCDDATLVSPTEHIANTIMEDAWLICFDEIQLADYASCTLLEGVFSHMIANGAVIVGTSNRAPLELGDSSITDNFDGETSSVVTSLSSFKQMFTENCLVHFLDSDRDHRIEMKGGETRFLHPISAKNEEKMDQLFTGLIEPGQKISDSFVNVYGRNVFVPMAAGKVSRFTFRELCQQPLGPADYLAICNNFEFIFVDNIPKMKIDQKNEARRFLSFIDAAYESRVKLYCIADASPEDLFVMLPRDDGDYDMEQMHFEMIGEIAYDLKMHGMDFRSLNIISGEDEIFSFKRAISRLHEMQSLFYQQTKYRPHRFIPYIGTKEERDMAEEKRRDREHKRQQILLEEAEKQNVDNQDLHLSFKKHNLQREYTDTDWGDEASYLTMSKEVYKNFDKKDINNRQKDAPKFGEKHFWGFGWWEHVKNKVKPPKNS